MRTPICYALTESGEYESGAKRLKLSEFAGLTFFEPDCENFPAMSLARKAARAGGTAPVVLNGANEAAVKRFLSGEIGFLQICEFTERALTALPAVACQSLETVFEYDAAARETVNYF